MAETATAAAKEDTGRKWEQKKFMCVVCAITLFVCQIIIIIYIYLEYFMLGVKMNFDKNFREIDNTNIWM